ncbi:MAG: phosphate transport system regulatory protein PhoU [Candidatus Altiarchaeales archaeon IMC4]|nr:MAG: phosphate transport system regulatory protein PhoU [Candidatus Altiarchaeales archaeon IMC4]
MVREKFDWELTKLKKDLRSMSELVQKNLSDSLEALRKRDMTLSSEVIEKDAEKIDVIHREIEERCILCIALHQPVAGDLRFLSTAMSVASNLERIGDYAKDIAMLVQYIIDEKPLDDVEETLQQMSDLCVLMTKHAMDSFIDKNKSYVEGVSIDEEKVDSLYGSIFPKLKKRMTANPDNASLGLNLLLAGRCLERIGDHALNISKRSMFVISGAWEYL